jgi:hypothetical protein
VSALLRPLARQGLAAALLCTTFLSAAACTSTETVHSQPPSSASGVPEAEGTGGSMAGTDGMDMASPSLAPPAEAAALSTGLADNDAGYIYLPAADTVAANAPTGFSFHITGPDDHALTRYQPYESKLVLFYLIRSDLTGFRELDPTMRQDGTWTVDLPALAPGSYRTYVSFAAPDSSIGTPKHYELSHPLTVPGRSADTALPAPSQSTTTDGYTLTLSGALKARTNVALAISVTSGGKPVSYFNRYLDGYAHVTGFHVGDTAFAHTLSTGRANGALTAQALFPESGMWRLYVEFETAGKLHTAAFTVNVP